MAVVLLLQELVDKYSQCSDRLALFAQLDVQKDEIEEVEIDWSSVGLQSVEFQSVEL